MWICDALCVSFCFGLCARRPSCAISDGGRRRRRRRRGSRRSYAFAAGARQYFIMRPSRRKKTCCDLLSSYQSEDLENAALYRCFFLLRSLPATRQSLPHFLCVVLHATTGFLLSLSSIIFRFLKPNWYLSLSLFRFRFSLSSLQVAVTRRVHSANLLCFVVIEACLRSF